MDERQQLERCERTWSEEPVFFISTCTNDRNEVFKSQSAVDLLVEEWALARKRHGWSVGRYLVLPDRVHFFCAADISARPLSQWLQIWKEWTAKRLVRELGLANPVWQTSFSKDLLHSIESYRQKLQFLQNDAEMGSLCGKTMGHGIWRGEIDHL